jgi:predicted negative regulator of RcsB-dependent stress response
VVAGKDATEAERDGWRAIVLPVFGDVLLASGDEDAARAAWTQDLAALARMSSQPGTQQMSGTPTESEIRERLSALA